MMRTTLVVLALLALTTFARAEGAAPETTGPPYLDAAKAAQMEADAKAGKITEAEQQRAALDQCRTTLDRVSRLLVSVAAQIDQSSGGK